MPPQPQFPSLGSFGLGVKCIASNNKQCKFPFKFRRKVRTQLAFTNPGLEIQIKVFASCTSDFDPENRAWCATDLNDRGEQVIHQVEDHFAMCLLCVAFCNVFRQNIFQIEFAYCPSSCPVDILTTPSPPIVFASTASPGFTSVT